MEVTSARHSPAPAYLFPNPFSLFFSPHYLFLHHNAPFLSSSLSLTQPELVSATPASLQLTTLSPTSMPSVSAATSRILLNTFKECFLHLQDLNELIAAQWDLAGNGTIADDFNEQVRRLWQAVLDTNLGATKWLATVGAWRWTTVIDNVDWAWRRSGGGGRTVGNFSENKSLLMWRGKPSQQQWLTVDSCRERARERDGWEVVGL